MAYNPKDFYFKQAKERHFAARSVFKLEEIDTRFKIFRPGQNVVDLGCAPGSWSQYASQKIGQKGFCIGIDLARVSLVIPNCVFVQGDAFKEETISDLLREKQIEQLDVVLSDMAPKTTGIRIQDQRRSFDLCKLALGVARRSLRPGGTFIVKFFQSEFFDEYMKEVKGAFDKVELLRPKSTRKASYEIYIIGLRMKSNIKETPLNRPVTSETT